jgi:hypothetical protein
MTPQFGWIPPTAEKQADNDCYQLRRIYAAPLTVEKQFAYPAYVRDYDQGQTGACTGYSSTWAMSIYNAKKYNPMWLYRRGQDTDGDPRTKDDDDGGYIWAVMDVLRKEGHALSGSTSPVKAEGIQSYYWCKSIDDIRSAIDAYRVPVFGIYWYNEFMQPRTINGEYWIGTKSSWGQILGGHAICCIAASDQRQAVRLLNSWGSGYPPVWISYASITKLLSQQGECAVGLDINPEPPTPPPPAEKLAVTVTLDSRTYAGELARTG